jgi:hypothetical protein
MDAVENLASCRMIKMLRKKPCGMNRPLASGGGGGGDSTFAGKISFGVTSMCRVTSHFYIHTSIETFNELLTASRAVSDMPRSTTAAQILWTTIWNARVSCSCSAAATSSDSSSRGRRSWRSWDATSAALRCSEAASRAAWARRTCCSKLHADFGHELCGVARRCNEFSSWRSTRSYGAHLGQVPSSMLDLLPEILSTDERCCSRDLVSTYPLDHQDVEHQPSRRQLVWLSVCTALSVNRHSRTPHRVARRSDLGHQPTDDQCSTTRARTPE